jgi:hypothetical protein
MRKDSTCCEFLSFHSLAYPPKILFSHLNKFASPCVPLKFFIVPSFLGSGNVPSKDSHGKTPMKLEPKLQDLVFVMWSPGNAHSTDFILFWNACFYFILECVVGERFLQDLHPWQSPLHRLYIILKCLFLFYFRMCSWWKIPARSPSMAKPTTVTSFIRIQPMFNFPLHRLLFL